MSNEPEVADRILEPGKTLVRAIEVPETIARQPGYSNGGRRGA
jgi:hypothetical protein